MALVRRPVVYRDHRHDMSVPHPCIERTAHPAIGAGRADGSSRSPLRQHRFLSQSPGRTFLHTSATRHAVGCGERCRFTHGRTGSCRRPGFKTPTEHRQGESALDFIAGPHTAGAGHASFIIKREERIRLVAIGLTARGILVALGTNATRIGQTLQCLRHRACSRLFREIQFDDIAPKLLEPFRVGPYDEPFSRRHRTGRRSSTLPLNFAETEAAGPEGIQMIRRTETRDGDPGFLGGLVDGVARLGEYSFTIDVELHRSRSRSTVYQVGTSSGHQVVQPKIVPPLRLDDIRLSDFPTFILSTAP